MMQAFNKSKDEQDFKYFQRLLLYSNLSIVKLRANRAADWVARQSREEMCPDGWVDRPPSSLVFILSSQQRWSSSSLCAGFIVLQCIYQEAFNMFSS